MDQLNNFLFYSIYNIGKDNLLIVDLGIFLAKYLLYILIFILFYFIFWGELNLKFNNLSYKYIRLILFIELIIVSILSRGIIVEFIHFFGPKLRPFDYLGIKSYIIENGPGMPSGHASFLFAVSMILFFWNKKWSMIYFILSLINGLARIFVGVHWPFDILVGMIVGIFSAILIHLIFEKQIFNKLLIKNSNLGI